MKDNKTINLKFKASIDGINEVYEQIKKISNTKGVNLTDNIKKQILEIERKLPGFSKTFNDAINNGTAIDIKEFQKQFDELYKIINSTLGKINTNTLSSPLKAELEKANAELDRVNKELAEKRKERVKLDKNIEDTGNYNQHKGLGSSKARQNESFKNAFQGAFNPTTTASRGSKAGTTQLTVGNDIVTLGTASVNSYEALEEHLAKTVQDENKRIEILTKINAELEKQYHLQQQSGQGQLNKVESEIKELEVQQQQAELAVEDVKKQATTSNIPDLDKKVIQETVDATTRLNNARKDANRAVDESIEAEKKERAENVKTTGAKNQNTDIINKNTIAQQKNTSAIGKAAKQVFTYGTIISAFRRIYSLAIRTVTEMDKALTDMAVVTSMSRKEAYELTGQFRELANTTGKTTTEIANMATKFYQQGKSTSQVLKLTEAAAKAATIAGIDGSRSIDLLTNAMNGFQMSASQAMEVSDKFAALAASAATDYEELATALSKVAAQANLAGMSMDFTLGLLTKGIETTREAPETIGTALKTVIARMRELSDYDKTLEDGTSVNRVDKALQNIGVALRDSNGEFRDLDTVLTEVGMKWDTLNKNQQANVAVALAGTRQQSRLIAMMQDFDRTLELVDTAANSYGATAAQAADYMEGLAAAQNRFTTTTQALINGLVNSDFVIGLIDLVTNMLSGVELILSNLQLLLPVLGAISFALGIQLVNNIKRWNYQVKINKLKKEERKLTIQNRLETIKAAKQALDNAINTRKTTEAKEDQLVTALQIAKLEAERRGDTASVAKYEQQIQAAKAQDKKTDIDLNSLRAERNALDAEEKLLLSESNTLSSSLASNFEGLPGILSTVIPILTFLPGLIGKVITKQKASNAEATKGTALQMGWSASHIPVAGWVIAGAILAAVGIAFGVAAAQAAGAFDSAKKADESMENTSKALQKLHAELYNINQESSTLTKLGNQFDDITSKVIKTEEEMEQLKEIIQQVNDVMGYEYITSEDTEKTVAAKIQTAKEIKQSQAQSKVGDMENTLAQGLSNAKQSAIDAYNNGRIWKGIANALFAPGGLVTAGIAEAANREQAQKDLQNELDRITKEYYNKLKTDDSFVNSVRAIGNAEIGALTDVSTETKDMVLDYLVEQAATMGSGVFTSEGINSKLFLNSIGGDSFIEDLDKVVSSGDFGDYVSYIEKLETTKLSNSAYEQQLNLLKKTNPVMAGIIDMGTEIAEKFDAAGYSVQQMNIFLTAMKSAGMSNTEIGELVKDGVDPFEAYKIAIAKLPNIQAEALAKINDQNSEYNQGLIKQAELMQKITTLQNKKEKTEAETEKLKQLTAEYAKIEEETGLIEKQAYHINEYAAELESLLPTTAVSEIVDELTKAGSIIENITKLNNIDNLSLKEKMEILQNYPELYERIMQGEKLTGIDMLNVLSTEIAENKQKAQANIEGNKLKSIVGNENTNAASKILGEEIIGAYFDNKDLGNAFIKNKSEQEEMIQKLVLGGMTKADAETYVNGLIANLENTAENRFIISEIDTYGISSALSTEQKETIQNALDKDHQLSLKISKYEMDLETLDKDSQEYEDTLNKFYTNIGKLDQSYVEELKHIEDQKAYIFGNIFDKEQEQSILDQIEIINGEVIYTGSMEDWTEEQRAAFDLAILSYGEYAKEEKEITEARKENLTSFTEFFIDQETQRIEAQIETLEKQKEAYEKYFEEIDALKDDFEYEQNREDILKQLDALAGGSDSASQSKRKELLQQLEELNNSEEERRQQAMRDSLIADIDSQTEALNTQLDKVNNSLNSILTGLTNGTFKIDENGNLMKVTGAIDEATGKPTWELYEYAKGGLVDFTGPAWVDGTPSNPEAFLSAADTRHISMLIAALDGVFTEDTHTKISTDEITSQNNAVEIGNINIHTDHLDNNQDFRSAGNTLAEEFAKAIQQRGINLNVKK